MSWLIVQSFEIYKAYNLSFVMFLEILTQPQTRLILNSEIISISISAATRTLISPWWKIARQFWSGWIYLGALVTVIGGYVAMMKRPRYFFSPHMLKEKLENFVAFLWIISPLDGGLGVQYEISLKNLVNYGNWEHYHTDFSTDNYQIP